MPYRFQTFTYNQVLTAAQMNQVEVNIRDHVHGVDGVVQVGTAGIADRNVTTAKIADGNVTTAKIADGNVTTAKIADGNVTGAKISKAIVGSGNVAISPDSTYTPIAGLYNFISSDIGLLFRLNIGGTWYTGNDSSSCAMFCCDGVNMQIYNSDTIYARYLQFQRF